MPEYKVKFYKNSSNGKEPVLDYIEMLDIKNKAKVLKYIEFLRVNNGYLDEPYLKLFMNKEILKNKKDIDFDVYLKKHLKNKEFKKHYDEFGKHLEVAYQLVQLRKEKRMSQTELARQIGTTQSNIARMESGQQNFTVGILSRIAGIFDKDLKISIC